jgi:hypothetical protein
MFRKQHVAAVAALFIAILGEEALLFSVTKM